ncbi:MAG: NAD(P)H-hydrate dehydratase [Candidatus Zixiibacteriota bacterium]
MKLVTAKQMQAIDAEAIQNRGIPSIELMENAGRGIAELARTILDDDVTVTDIALFCGKGNNGGDGFVIGRYLHEWGASVHFYLLGMIGDLKGDAAVNCNRAVEQNLPISEMKSEGDLPYLIATDLVIDAIFGTGFEGEVRGLAAPCIELMNASGAPILAVDAPSGLNCDTGEVSGVCVQAFATGTLALPKIGQFLYPGRSYVGTLEVIPIGIPDDVVEQAAIKINLIDQESVNRLLPVRLPTAHKGTCGKLFILAGSRGYTGAACLAAESSIRSGVGLCYLGVPMGLNPIFETKLTEVITRPLPDVAKKQCLALRGMGEIRQYLKDTDAAVIGPGLGTHHETRELIRRLIPDLVIPTIIDADGLNAIENHSDELSKCGAPLVITPHPGELSRLIDVDVPSIAKDRMTYALDAAQRFGCVVLLKGAPTFVADPSGEVFVNPTGNAGMATGGTGDILSGIIGAFLAQGISPLNAACIGAYIHGRAADVAVRDIGPTALIPSDIISYLAEVYMSFNR